MKSILYHARRSEDDKTPVFTIRFAHGKESVPNLQVDCLLCVVSKPHSNLESYCKKTGNTLTKARLDCFLKELNNTKSEVIKIETLKTIKTHLPRGVSKTLYFYANKARKYFKINNENPCIVIRGTQINWEPKNSGSLARKTTKILVGNLNNIK